MIVKASNKCLVQRLVPNMNNLREKVETVNDSLVPSSCSALPPSAAWCFIQPFEMFSCPSCLNSNTPKSYDATEKNTVN